MSSYEIFLANDAYSSKIYISDTIANQASSFCHHYESIALFNLVVLVSKKRSQEDYRTGVIFYNVKVEKVEIFKWNNIQTELKSLWNDLRVS